VRKHFSPFRGLGGFIGQFESFGYTFARFTESLEQRGISHVFLCGQYEKNLQQLTFETVHFQLILNSFFP
jgi:hypothetical protein